jgi:hypothetical protein
MQRGARLCNNSTLLAHPQQFLGFPDVQTTPTNITYFARQIAYSIEYSLCMYRYGVIRHIELGGLLLMGHGRIPMRMLLLTTAAVLAFATNAMADETFCVGTAFNPPGAKKDPDMFWLVVPDAADGQMCFIPMSVEMAPCEHGARCKVSGAYEVEANGRRIVIKHPKIERIRP